MHPKNTKMPNPPAIVVYYITQILRVPVFSDTDLSIFKTKKWYDWVKSHNLDPFIVHLMNGTMKERYGLELPDGVGIHLEQDAISIVEKWLQAWDKMGKRSYQHHDSTIFRQFIVN